MSNSGHHRPPYVDINLCQSVVSLLHLKPERLLRSRNAVRSGHRRRLVGRDVCDHHRDHDWDWMDWDGMDVVAVPVHGVYLVQVVVPVAFTGV